jgi:retinol dehydrogenase-14
MQPYVPPDMHGRTVLVTGGSGGIGFETARALALAGATVGLTARDAGRGAAARDAISEAAGHDRVELYLCDFEDLTAVHRLVDEVRSVHECLDVLVNNAGAIFSMRGLTAQGLELTWQVDHLCAFLLTNLLSDLLAAASPSRVITVSSDAHLRAVQGIDFDDPSLERAWSPFKAYAQAKLANVMFAYELARRWEMRGVMSNAVHPGPVRSGFGMQDWGWYGRLWSLGRRFMLTPQEGADTIVWLASSRDLEGRTGEYFYRRKPKRSSRASYDRDAQRRLWELSAGQTGLGAGASE